MVEENSANESHICEWAGFTQDQNSSVHIKDLKDVSKVLIGANKWWLHQKYNNRIIVTSWILVDNTWNWTFKAADRS